MKTAAKVFTVISSVLLFWTIIEPIFAAIAWKKMKTITRRADLTKWAVLTLIFMNFWGGLFMLLTKDKDYACNAPAPAPEAPAAAQ